MIFGFSVSAFCIGFILGRYAETGYNNTLIITHKNFLELFSRPAFLIVLAILIIMAVLMKRINTKKDEAKKNEVINFTEEIQKKALMNFYKI